MGRWPRSRLLFAAIFLGCGGGQAPPTSTQAALPSSVDTLRDVDGTAIGTSADAITDLEPVTPLGRAVRKRKAPKAVFGSMPIDASYTFDKSDKVSGGIWSLASADCDKVSAAIRQRFGPPSDDHGWEGKEIRLVVSRLGGNCGLVWGLRENFSSTEPPAKTTTSTATPHFGNSLQFGSKSRSRRTVEKCSTL